MAESTIAEILKANIKHRFGDPRPNMQEKKKDEVAIAKALAHIKETTGVTLARTTLVDLLKGRRKPSEALLYTLAHAFGLPFNFLLATLDKSKNDDNSKSDD